MPRPTRHVGTLSSLLAVGALAFAAGASAAPKADLSVAKLGAPPAIAEPGSTFPLSGKVANGGDSDARATIRFSLRSGPDAGPLGVKLRARRIDEVPAGRSVRFLHALQIPVETAPGEYGVAACVRRHGGSGPSSCTLAKNRMTITDSRLVPGEDSGPTGPPPAPGPSPTPDPAPEPGPTDPPPVEFTPGARSAGDVLFPEIGNGGYDARHYDIALEYDPAANVFDAATTTITAEATQNLSEFSLDFEGLDVARIFVDGQQAAFSGEGTKLIVDPPGDGIPQGETFATVVEYSGAPQHITDPDGSIEGWIGGSQVDDGAFVVNEPIGAQSWFPSNNYPTDKASYDFRITVPATSTALGNGELVANTLNGDGTRTWHWRHEDPLATYLTTSTVGTFDYTTGSMTEAGTGHELDIYRAVDTGINPAQKLVVNGELDRIPSMSNFLAGIYGAYPFESTGAVVDRTSGVGYALEVQTKPHFASATVAPSTLLHELAHQWFGDAVTLATWSDIWFNEGWAVWSEWFWGFETQSSPLGPEAQFRVEYNSASDEDWAVAPAELDGDPANLFAHFPVYVRSAMTLQGYREIVGHEKFLELAHRLQTERGYGHVSTAEFIALAKEVSGFTGAELDRLGEYFQQWLYGETKPSITPDTF